MDDSKKIRLPVLRYGIIFCAAGTLLVIGLACRLLATEQNSVSAAKEDGNETRTPVPVAQFAGDSPLYSQDEGSVKTYLSEEHKTVLNTCGWTERTNGTRAVWISIAGQVLRVIESDEIIWSTRCATAAKGPGSEANSEKTPLGWHVVAEKIGEHAPWGQVFRSRVPTKHIWQPGESTKEDLVLTRILALDGEEPGKNKGGNVDSFARNIYIHGTNAEELIGTPSSHGCIRLTNDDVITAFRLIPKGAHVLITE